jgi:hypothetical protein
MASMLRFEGSDAVRPLSHRSLFHNNSIEAQHSRGDGHGEMRCLLQRERLVSRPETNLSGR